MEIDITLTCRTSLKVMLGENVSSAPIHVPSLMEIDSWQWQALMA